MTRILFSLLLVLGCMGFPVQAHSNHSSSTTAAPTASAKSAKTTEATAKTAQAPASKPATTSVAKASAPETPSASTKNSTDLVWKAPAQTVATTKAGKAALTTSSGPIRIGSAATAASNKATAKGRLARLTAYWPSEGDYYTRHGISSTGIHLHGGHCAVDPRIIPYGSVVEIAGVGKYLAVDTGSAVISREAAREAANTTAERNALVVDLYFESRKDAQVFSSNAPKYASISWYTPDATGNQATADRHLFADENWSKIQSKQL